jgi:hypothetical protein
VYPLEDGQGGSSHVGGVGVLQHALNKALATIQQVPYDGGLIHGVPPDEMMEGLHFHQDTPWIPSLQNEGTPMATCRFLRSRPFWPVRDVILE